MGAGGGVGAPKPGSSPNPSSCSLPKPSSGGAPSGVGSSFFLQKNTLSSIAILFPPLYFYNPFYQE